MTEETPLVVSPAPHNEYLPFLSPEGADALGLLLLGQAAFALEKRLLEVSPQRVEIIIRQPFLPSVNTTEVASELRLLFNLVLLRDFELSIRFEVSEPVQANGQFGSANAVCLFSGGVDSVCGILETLRKTDQVHALFCSHVDQSKINGIVRRLSAKLLEPAGIKLAIFRMPEIGRGRFAQLRGFLYLTTGLAVAWLARSAELVVSEVGPTMYQPRFGPLDQVTLTTHPYVVERVRVISALFLRAARIELPFENNTKAEVLAQCRRPDVITHTHSCITQRFGRHDGTCYACIMRRLSAVASNVLDVEYDRDPLTDETARADNLIDLLDYCLGMLTNYGEMPAFRRENIEIFGKRDLFRRFSLDMYSALLVLTNRGVTLARPTREYYGRALEAVGRELLNKRIEVLRSMRENV
ncbi:MAG TPA: hypothetical protein VGG03_12935 [Thermoanaerobaculia bacterium]